MPIYNILPTKNMGQNLSILAYSSQKQLYLGQIVEINIRNNVDFGLVLGENTDKTENKEGEAKKYEIKEISKILPTRISSQQLEWIKTFADNSFNSINDIWDAIWRPMELLTKKQWLELDVKSDNQLQNNNTLQNNTESQSIEPKIEFLLDFDITLRIMYIIRSVASNFDTTKKALKQGKTRQILIVFPEKKYLDKIYKQIDLEIKNNLKNNPTQFELLYFTGDPTKKSKETIWNMIQPKNITQNSETTNIEFKKNEQKENQKEIGQTIQIIMSTRSGLFLPFENLEQIILIDEGNSMYIQDQNSLYYDTREAIFLISKAFLSNIFFVSTLPSVRLHSFYDKELLETQITKVANEIQKPRKIKITKYDKKSAKYDIFGWEIEQILRPDEEIV